MVLLWMVLLGLTISITEEEPGVGDVKQREGPRGREGDETEVEGMEAEAQEAFEERGGDAGKTGAEIGPA